MAPETRGGGHEGRQAASLARIGIPLVAVVGIALSLALAWATHRLQQEDHVQAFKMAAYDRIEDVRVQIAADVETLRALGNLYATVPEVSHEVFHGFTRRSMRDRPSIQALEWAEVVPAAERAAFEARMASRGHPDFAITERHRQSEMTPAAPRDVYYPVTFVEPHAGNELAMGFDLGSEPSRRQTLERARDTGTMAATPGIAIVQEKGSQSAFLLFFPIYRQGMPTSTVAERRGALKGFALGVFRIGDIVAAAARQRPRDGEFQDVALSIHDISDPPDIDRLYSSGTGSENPEARSRTLHASETLDVGGRRWRIVVTPAGRHFSAAGIWIAVGVLGLGLTMTGLLGAYVRAVLEHTEEVRREKARAETYLDLVGSIVVALDLEGRIVLINRQGCEALGASAGDLQGRDWFEVALPEDRRAEVQAVFREIVAGNVAVHEHIQGHEILASDGTRRRIDWHNTLLRDDQDRIVGVLASGQDVTDRLAAEEEIRRSLAVLEVLASLLRLSLRTGSLQEFLAGALDQILGLPWLAVQKKGCIFLSDGEGGSLSMVVQRGLEGGPAVACREVPLGRCLCGRAAQERRILFCDHVDGRHETTFPNMQPHGHYCVPFGAGDGVLGLLNLYVREGHRRHRNEMEFLEAVADTLALIVERKHAEARLQESEERFRVTATAAQDAVVMVGSSGQVVLWNPAAARIFGYEAEEVLGRAVHEVLTPPRYRQQAETGFSAFHRTGTGPMIGKLVPLTASRRDGTEFPIEIAINAVHGKDGWGAVAIVRDVSHRVLTEARLRQAEKAQALGNLASGVAHELNNLLLPIVALGELIQSDLPVESRNRRRLDKIVEAARRSAEIVAQIGAFTRQDEPRWEELALRPVIVEAMAMVRATLPSSITIEERLDDVGRMRGDPEQVQTVLLNLASNAADAMAGHAGTLDVILEAERLTEEQAGEIPGLRPGPHARLTMKDSGVGMDAGTLARIFDPFFTTKEVGKGAGLGLSAIHGILMRHDGAITVASQLGKGTTFVVYLPLLEEG